MRAFVLSGGGNRGAIQVGALRALLEHGIQPEMIVGCSAGALNATFLAQSVSLDQMDLLLNIWRNTGMNDVYPGSRFSVLWRLVSGADSLYDNRSFYAFLQRQGAEPAMTFAELPCGLPTYITATDLETESLHVFGDQPGDRVLDALMASTALPPLHPPWIVNGQCFIDGGTVSPLPLRVAIERGATEIYALNIWDNPSARGKIRRGISAAVNRSLNTMFRLQVQHDLDFTHNSRHIRLHEIRLTVENMPELSDWGQSDRLHDAGYATALSYLDSQEKAEMAEIVGLQPLTRLGHIVAREWVRLSNRRSLREASAGGDY